MKYRKTAIQKPIIVEFLKKHKDMPIRTAAKQLYALHPGVFSSMDNVRTAINRITGKAGKQVREVVKELIRTPEDGKMWRNYLVKPIPEEFKVHQLPDDQDYRWFVFADTHMQQHDDTAIGAAVEYAIKEKCNGVIALGDIPDLYQLSRFTKDPDGQSVKQEQEAVKMLWQMLRMALNPKHIIWKLGNHEGRVYTYLFNHAVALSKVMEVQPGNLFGTKEYGITMIKPKDWLQHRGLVLMHGDEYGNGTGTVNRARSIFLKTFSSTIVAHSHQESVNTVKTALDEVIKCWSIGCLCQMHPQYATGNQWSQGFGILETYKNDKIWKFTPKTIIGGTVV